mgnify:CR=1 FL=1
MMKEKLQNIKEEALKAIEAADMPEKLNDVRVKFLGKKGELTAVLKGMKDVAPEDRPKVGQMVNETRAAIEAVLEENKEKEKRAYEVCLQKIEKHKLDMNLTEVEYAFDGSKILFYFTADGRVDFRELVKDLASTFHTRIELRQIGVRDEAKMLGGLGVCGRPFCCSTFLNDFHSVSIKMAKEQGLSLSPSKISGTCGRLMCCLKYEQNSYEYLAKITPRRGTVVDCREGRGTVVDAALLTGKLKVQLDNAPEGAPVIVNREEVRVVRTPRRGGKNEKKADKPAQAEK